MFSKSRVCRMSAGEMDTFPLGPPCARPLATSGLGPFRPLAVFRRAGREPRRSGAPVHRGAILPLAAVMLVVLLGFIAFAVDTGYMLLCRTQLQCAADSGALAGAGAMRDGAAAARIEAESFAQRHVAAGSPVKVIAAEDIELGLWDESTRTFSPLSALDEANANAIRLTCRCTAARGNAASLFFTPLLGIRYAEPSASAIALASSVRCGPFIGLTKVSMSSTSHTDSYNSDIGPYSHTSPGDQGHVCSNGSISMSGSAIVRGDAHPGKGCSVSTSGSAFVTGSKTPLTKALTYPGVDFGNAATANNNSSIPLSTYGKKAVDSKNKFSLSGGDHVDLPPGTYYFSGFSLSGGSTVSTSGRTIIYCTGDFAISGSSVMNQTQLPSNLQLYATGGKCDISGSSDLYAYVYCPGTPITRSGSSEFYGALIGSQLTLSGSGGLHYDQSLGRLNPNRQQSKLVQCWPPDRFHASRRSFPAGRPSSWR